MLQVVTVVENVKSRCDHNCFKFRNSTFELDGFESHRDWYGDELGEVQEIMVLLVT
jgi:hypothetical protein